MDEESTKSDEEYDDLAMQDTQQSGYCSDDDEESMNKFELSNKVVPVSGDLISEEAINFDEIYQQKLGLFFRSEGEASLGPSQLCYSSFLGNSRSIRRSQSMGNV